MNKRGQFIFAFVLIGIAVVAAFAFLYYISYVQSGKEFKPGLVSQLSLTSETASFKNYVQSCLEETTNEGIDYFGVLDISEPLIEEYIEGELPKCVDFQAFEEFGLEVSDGVIKSEVLITDKSILVDVTWPLTLEKQGSVAKMSEFNYYLKRERSAEFTFDANDETTEEEIIRTEDGDAELVIPAGTRVYDSSGNVVDEVTLKVLDKNFEGMSNAPVVGMVVYNGLPDGARFDPPITMTIDYEPYDIPPGVAEESLRIAWFDKRAGIWKSIPTQVDTVNHRLTAQIRHFTLVAVAARCSNELEDKYTIGWELVFEQMCGMSYSEEDGDDELNCMETEWDYDEESEEYTNSYHEKDEATYVEGDGVKILEPNPNYPYGQIPFDMYGSH